MKNAETSWNKNCYSKSMAESVCKNLEYVRKIQTSEFKLTKVWGHYYYSTTSD